jgi:predicted RNA-binding protein with PUA domain
MEERIMRIMSYNSAPQMHQKKGSVKLNHLWVIWCAFKTCNFDLRFRECSTVRRTGTPD